MYHNLKESHVNLQGQQKNSGSPYFCKILEDLDSKKFGSTYEKKNANQVLILKINLNPNLDTDASASGKSNIQINIFFSSNIIQ